jgi:hypothetical protein
VALRLESSAAIHRARGLLLEGSHDGLQGHGDHVRQRGPVLQWVEDARRIKICAGHLAPASRLSPHFDSVAL